MKPTSTRLLIWSLGTAIFAAWSASGLELRNDARRLLVPASTSRAHGPIELACEACHTEPFAGPDGMQAACLGCHAEDLKAGQDSHPESKFTDPRNAGRVAVLDARYCVTCHAEHVPERTHALGVTQPNDFCVNCHAEIGDERASHRGLPFDGCTDAGCHNFHDNRALYEDFLVKHAGDPELHEPAVPELEPIPYTPGGPSSASTVALTLTEGERHAWETSAHARAGLGCDGCHESRTESGVVVSVEVPGVSVCRNCHANEAKTFFAGRHGMALAQELPPLAVAAAGLAMKDEARGRHLDCGSCHGAHEFDRGRARTEACVGCHDDEHTRAFWNSKHAALGADELAGVAPPGSGVHCSTCHLPRTSSEDGHVFVLHDQNATLRPNEKMARSVCMNCHGLPFALDALADAALVRRNFSGRPGKHVKSFSWALARAPKIPPSASSDTPAPGDAP